ncbi:RNA cytidine acetyltransferase isoform X1 [Microplitis mediator]|uniref:RNA cytidine acetyltransferase isoform X1 n=1 Tax=Microplitis mediator TaxID=375433 RepID=UPI002557260A|nr:RNA cytidine acetyltransferase isoform X1 [Microplitis mediator]
MVRKKLDNRIRTLIENGVSEGHRTMFVVIGEKARDQIVVLHHMLLKSSVKPKPNILWCYKKELGFSSHRQKRMKKIKNKVKAGKIDTDSDDPFEIFVLSSQIRYCYYNETHTILGQTFGMCILQDFEALTPNLLARTIETVEGGGLVILLLQSVNSLKQLYTMTMDVHQRYRTEAHQDIVCRFNERFLLSLASCKRCLAVDDQLRVLPISSQNLKIDPVPKASADDESSNELNLLKESFQDTQPISSLINCCKTADQAKALLKFIETISEKTLRSTVSLTAARGRGKSATLGLAIAGAVAFGYSNIYITSPSPENLKTVFEFICKGFDALAYSKTSDYDLIESTNPEFRKAIVRINVTRDHRQTIQYIHPTDSNKLSQAELLVIDEAAAIPLPYVKSLLGPYLVFLSSTINGYEGTGRSLSLKLLQQLRSQSTVSNTNDKSEKAKLEKSLGRQLLEITLDESIRYKPGDQVEDWLTKLLCLDVITNAPILSGCPPPDTCQLYYINRDTLFSYHKASEMFLQRLVALYVASHYKNSPNDLLMMSDAPAHHLFCLLGPVDPSRTSLPEILVVIQVCLEGEIKKSTVASSLGRGQKAAGDLIPWTLAQHFHDNDFPNLSGARIVRIATHPDYHRMGYGTRALELLKHYYEMKIPNIDDENKTTESEMEIKRVPEEQVDLLEETIEPRASLPPLLLKLSERKPEHLDYLGVSYGLTEQILKFWKRSEFVPVFLSRSCNDITGEHSCIMICKINSDDQDFTWLESYWNIFRRRFTVALGSTFAKYSPSLGLGVLTNKVFKPTNSVISKETLDVYFTAHDLKCLEMYSNNMADYHSVSDFLPSLAQLYFLNMMGETHLSPVQAAILLGLGLQRKTVDQLAQELTLQSSQLLGLFNRCIRKAVQYLNGIVEGHVEKTLIGDETVNDNLKVDVESGKSMQKELDVAARKLEAQQKIELEKLQRENLHRYAIKGTDEEWDNSLKSKGTKSLISVKSAEKRMSDAALEFHNDEDKKKNKKKKRFSK